MTNTDSKIQTWLPDVNFSNYQIWKGRMHILYYYNILGARKLSVFAKCRLIQVLCDLISAVWAARFAILASPPVITKVQ